MNPINNKLLKANDVAMYLNISKSMAYQMMQNGRIPTIRIGRAVRVRPSDLEDFVINNYVEFDDKEKVIQPR